MGQAAKAGAHSMKLCVAGTRGFYGPAFYVATRIGIAQATKRFHINAVIDEIVSGMCKNSPDWIGVDLAKEANVPLKPFYAAWNDLTAPGAIIRKRHGRAYNARAGHDRNLKEAEYLAQHDHLVVVIWDGKSPGTTDFLTHCKNLNLCYHDIVIPSQEEP